MANSKHVPVGWPAVIPRIFVDDPEALVAFIQHVFGAVGRFRPEGPSELRIGDSIVMVGSTVDRRAMPGFLYVYVEDVDRVFQCALDRGAESLEEPQDMPYGDRRAMVRDPWDNTWQIATHRGRFTVSRPPNKPMQRKTRRAAADRRALGAQR
jgi:PhnB protein